MPRNGLAVGAAAAAALAAAAPVPAAEPGPASGLPPALAAACREALPDEMAEAAEAGAVRGATADGEWWIDSAQMDGAGAPEAVLVVLPADRGGRVRFLAQRADGKIEKKKVKLSGTVTHVAVSFEPFMEGRALAHVNAGEAGQALLDWNGDKLDTVWDVGRTGEGERRWFTVEDLDRDGVGEVIVYYQRVLDVFFVDEDDLEGTTPGGDTARVDVVAVYRWNDGEWKKDRELLESLR